MRFQVAARCSHACSVCSMDYNILVLILAPGCCETLKWTIQVHRYRADNAFANLQRCHVTGSDHEWLHVNARLPLKCFNIVLWLLSLFSLLTLNGTKLPKLRCCAVKNLLTHSLTLKSLLERSTFVNIFQKCNNS